MCRLSTSLKARARVGPGDIRTHSIGAVPAYSICVVLTGLDFDASIANGSIIPLVVRMKGW